MVLYVPYPSVILNLKSKVQRGQLFRDRRRKFCLGTLLDLFIFKIDAHTHKHLLDAQTILTIDHFLGCDQQILRIIKDLFCGPIRFIILIEGNCLFPICNSKIHRVIPAPVYSQTSDVIGFAKGNADPAFYFL